MSGNKYKNVVLFALALVAFFLITNTVNAEEVTSTEETVCTEETGQTNNDELPYINQFVVLEDKIYYYNELGELYKDQIFSVDNKYYVADKKGALYLNKNWRVVQTSDKKYHYVNEYGELYIPQKTTIINWRAVDKKGNIIVKKDGIFKCNGKYYIANPKGIIYHGKRQIIKLNNKKYICRKNGSLISGKKWKVVKVSKNNFYFVNIKGKIYQPSKFTIKEWRGITKSGKFKIKKNGTFWYKKQLYIANNKGVIYHGKKQLVSFKGKQYGVGINGIIYRNTYFNINNKECYSYNNGIVIILKESAYLNVPIICQYPELPTGCEITSVAQLINYSGKKVDKVVLAKEMPYHSSDPNQGYVGNPFTNSGWTIYPNALMDLVKKYTGSCKNMTNCSISDIKWQITKKKPVVVWVGNFNGWNLHCILLTGYDKDKFYYNDCASGTKKSISISQFKSHWSVYGNKALSY